MRSMTRTVWLRRHWNSMVRSRAWGMTLIEVVLALGLMVLISAMVYWFYGSTVETRDKDLKHVTKLKLARSITGRISQELRQVAANTQFRDVAIQGQPERIWIAAVRNPVEQAGQRYIMRGETPPAEFDLYKIEYKIVRHPEVDHDDGYPLPLGLARIEHRVPRPDTAETGEAFQDPDAVGMTDEITNIAEDAAPDEFVEDPFADEEDEGDVELQDEVDWEELYAREILFLRFCYYDGNKWWDSWDIQGDNPLPQLVQIVVGFSPRPPFGETFGAQDDVDYDEFCTCMNDDPQTCEPLAGDQFATVVRMTQADIFFTSRITREAQALVEELQGGGE